MGSVRGVARFGAVLADGSTSLSRPVSYQQQSTIPSPRGTSPLRVLAGLACVAVIVASVAVTILVVKVLSTADDVNRAVDDASRSARRLDTRSRDLQPTIRELRDAARSLQSLNPGAGP